MMLSNKYIKFVPGQFCTSKQGRDKDKVYVIYEIVDEDYVLLVDGIYKNIKNPKKKNIKHLQIINDKIDEFETLKNESKLHDFMIKRFIKLKIQEDKVGK